MNSRESNMISTSSCIVIMNTCNHRESLTGRNHCSNE